MSQNITIMGASYSAVPAVNLPKTGGGTASFTDVTDTTATASDVASGKYFYTADGTRTAGTSSGGGGASNFVHGEFHTNSTAGVQVVDIPYTGSGYPVSVTVVVKGGAYASDTDWYSLNQRYCVGLYSMTKSNMTTAPTYATSGAQNQGVVAVIYKSSGATSYARTSSMTINAYSPTNASASSTVVVRINADDRMSVYVDSGGYCLAQNMDYEYFIAYSS